MTKDEVCELLRAGDCLLYRGSGAWSWLIRWKTWSDYSHVEIYLGQDQTITSRGKTGVRVYPFTDEHLVKVLRPVCVDIDLTPALSWARDGDADGPAALGQKYDYWGLLRFYTWGKQSVTKQFCSEICTRFYRRCRVRFHAHASWMPFLPFGGQYDADLVSPGMYDSSPAFTVVGVVTS